MQKYGEDETSEPILNYTTIPLDNTQCVPHRDICSAMQAITDHLNNDVNRILGNGTCFLNAKCLTITCVTLARSPTVTTTITLSPCDCAVHVKVSVGSSTRYTKQFKESGLDFFTLHSRRTLLQVNLVTLQNGAAIGLKVNFFVEVPWWYTNPLFILHMFSRLVYIDGFY